MPSTFFGLNIATSGMNAYNMGLNTTAHNISNRNTKGYSKQSVEQKAGIQLSLRTSYGMLGTGVEVTDTGFTVYDTRIGEYAGVSCNSADTTYHYLAIGE